MKCHATIGFVWESMTIWWTPCITLLFYNSWWSVGWCGYLRKAVDFVDCVWRFTRRSALCICPLVKMSTEMSKHTYAKLQFCLGVSDPLVDVMHYAFTFWWMITADGLCILKRRFVWSSSGYHTLEPYAMFIRSLFRYLAMSVASRPFSCV